MNTCSYIHMSESLKEPPFGLSITKPVCNGDHLDPGTSDARRESLMSSRTVESLADTFRVLGDPTRVRILDALSAGELCVCDIAGLIGISESAVSHQLRLLRGMRLVRPRRAGRQVYYMVDDHHILELMHQAFTHVQEERRDASGNGPHEPMSRL
jgi:DNA-binding transcriptional ArsR family regulator